MAEHSELILALLKLNKKKVLMKLTAAQNSDHFLHIEGELIVTKSSIVEFKVGEVIVRADTVHKEQIDYSGGKDIWEIVFWMNSVSNGYALQNGVHCSIRPLEKQVKPLKKYRVSLCYSGYKVFNVEAENESEAHEKAEVLDESGSGRFDPEDFQRWNEADEIQEEE